MSTQHVSATSNISHENGPFVLFGNNKIRLSLIEFYARDAVPISPDDRGKSVGYTHVVSLRLSNQQLVCGFKSEQEALDAIHKLDFIFDKIYKDWPEAKLENEKPSPTTRLMSIDN